MRTSQSIPDWFFIDDFMCELYLRYIEQICTEKLFGKTAAIQMSQ